MPKIAKIHAEAVAEQIEAKLALDKAQARLDKATQTVTRCHRLHTLGVVAYGRREYGDDGSAWCAWWVLSAEVLPIGAIRDALADIDRAYTDGVEPSEVSVRILDSVAARVAHAPIYRGPGQVFIRQPGFRASRTRVLVTQNGGWDI